MKTLLNVPGGNLRKANDGMLRRFLFLSLMMLLVPFVGTDACTNLIVGVITSYSIHYTKLYEIRTLAGFTPGTPPKRRPLPP